MEQFEKRSPARESFEKDLERIETWLAEEVLPSANGIAIFACSGESFFEPLQLEAPIERHRLTAGDRPHLYPLARIVDRYPRHAVLLSDTNHARIFVFGRGRTIEREEVKSLKVSRTDAGGWSQMRYQRHVEDHWLHHAKDVVEALGRIVAEDRAEYVFLAGDEVIVPLLRDQLPKDLAKKVLVVLRLEMRAPSGRMWRRKRLSPARRESEASASDARGECRAGSLAALARRRPPALENGQVEGTLISGAFAESRRLPGTPRGRLRAARARHGREGPVRGNPRSPGGNGRRGRRPALQARRVAAGQLTRRTKGRSMSKNNVHPDHYKVGGRDRQDDAASARFSRSIAAKAASQQRPDRMTKAPYFQRPESAAAGGPVKSAPKKSAARKGTVKKSAAPKASAPRKTAARKAPRKAGGAAKRALRKK